LQAQAEIVARADVAGQDEKVRWIQLQTLDEQPGRCVSAGTHVPMKIGRERKSQAGHHSDGFIRERNMKREGEAPREPMLRARYRLGRSLALPATRAFSTLSQLVK